MTKRTEKVGISGKYGSRYGVKLRKRMKEVEELKVKKHTCPNCRHSSVKRVSTAIWRCSKCKLVFAGGAYRPIVKTSYKRKGVELDEQADEFEEGK